LLTAAGNTNFPGLTNADLGAGPYHNRFVGFSSIPMLGTSNATGNAIIIGGTGGSITNPGGSVTRTRFTGFAGHRFDGFGCGASA
jgi:hypothetical protein